MKNLKYTFIFTLLTMLFSSCEEVETVELKSAEEKYVIEGNLSNLLGSATISISRTKNADVSGSFNGISGAVVTITDESGKVSRLTESNAIGIYTDPFLKGIPETNYRLKVAIDGQTFTAASKMPSKSKLEAVGQLEASALDGKRKFSTVKFNDPAGKGHAYRFIEYRNGIYNKVISVINDELFDGNSTLQVLRPKSFTEDTRYNVGDQIKIEFLNIDAPVFKYWFSSDKGIQSIGENTTPINPASNIDGGALGYFSAHSLQSMEYTVK